MGEQAGAGRGGQEALAVGEQLKEGRRRPGFGASGLVQLCLWLPWHPAASSSISSISISSIQRHQGLRDVPSTHKRKKKALPSQSFLASATTSCLRSTEPLTLT
jgi:hypothetical protein